MRTPGGWRIARRVCRITWWTGNPSVNETIAGVTFDLATTVLRREADAGRVGALTARTSATEGGQLAAPARHGELNRSSSLWGSAVAGAATDTRKTAGAARHATRTGELATRAAADAWDAALPARTAARAVELASGAAVAVGVAAAPARVLLEDDVRGSHCRASRESFSCRHRRNSNRCGNSATNHQRFDQIQFR